MQTHLLSWFFTVITPVSAALLTYLLLFALCANGSIRANWIFFYKEVFFYRFQLFSFLSFNKSLIVLFFVPEQVYLQLKINFSIHQDSPETKKNYSVSSFLYFKKFLNSDLGLLTLVNSALSQQQSGSHLICILATLKE